MHKLFLAMSSLALVLSQPVVSAECDTAYLAHTENVLDGIASHDPSRQQLALAQRDCLAEQLQTATSLCATFRVFEREFLTQSEDVQRQQGPFCRASLLRTYNESH